MLKSIDVLIGLIVVLLALSMAVTMITQSITAIVNSRGRHLCRGLADLLQQLDPALTASVSNVVATRLLMHPLVSGSSSPIAADAKGSGVGSLVRRIAGGTRLGNVVHREEFTKLLLGLAGSAGSEHLDAATAAVLKGALARNGIENPDATLAAIRTLALRLERSNPALAHGARQNLAILEAAESDFVAKINNWFDQSMDRTSQRFTASTRVITFAGAFVVAFGLQVDTLSLVNRLAADDAMRQEFVNQAVAANNARARASIGNTGGAAAVPSDDAVAQEYRGFLVEHGVITLPTGRWSDLVRIRATFFGVLITALLLSLGAPFWYSALGNLLQLRSVLAVKDDVQRSARQSNDPPGGAGTTGIPPALTGGRD